MCQYKSLMEYQEGLIKRLWITVYSLISVIVLLILTLIALGMYETKRSDEYEYEEEIVAYYLKSDENGDAVFNYNAGEGEITYVRSGSSD